MPSSEISTVEKFVYFLDQSGDADASQYLLGNRIPSYKWDGESFYEDEAAYYYPVYGDGSVVGIYTLIDPLSNGPGATFGVEFSQQLQKVIDDGCTEYFLVHYDNQTFVYGDNTATQIAKLQFSPVPEERDSDEVTDGTEKLAPEPSIPSSSRSKVKDHDVKVKGLNETDLADSINESNFEFAFNTDLNESAKSRSNDGFIDVTPTKTARASDFYYLPVGNYDQGNENTCWAVATYLIGQYKSGITYYDPYYICDYENKTPQEGGSIDNAKHALLNIYDVTSYFKNGYYTGENVRFFIDRDAPLYSAWYNAARKWGHSVCVNGYYSDGSGAIVISETSETYAGKYLQVKPTSNGDFKFTRVGQLMTWSQSLVLIA